jgi:hypothetical protein
MPHKVFHLLAVGALVLHLLWIVWVAFGALRTRNRPVLRFLHIASLTYGILIETLPWPPCPLTILEQYLEVRAGVTPYQGSFLVHYLEAVIYPNIPERLLVACAVAVCVFNLSVYVARYRKRHAAGW